MGRLKETAAIIGHHFALAGEPERALHHLTVAGEYAAANFAIDEAVSSYRPHWKWQSKPQRGLVRRVRQSTAGRISGGLMAQPPFQRRGRPSRKPSR